MSLNVGNISARFGLDPSEFLEKMRGVSGSTKFFSDEMKRSMKETSREGNEAFRLIDESLGIHITRPLTRLLTREFPGFASALQSVLGIGAVGALAAVGFEAFEKVSKAIEKAQKAQEALRTATENVNSVFAQEISAYKEKDKAITAATEKVNKLIEAQEKQTKAAEEASGPWSRLLASFGNFATKASSFQSTLDISQINKQLGEFKQKYDTAAFTDSINGSHEAMKLLNQEIAKASKMWGALRMQAWQGHAWYEPGRGIPAEEVAAAKDYLEQLKQIQKVQNVTTAGVGAEEAKQAQAVAQERLLSLYREMGPSLAKLTPETDPLKKLNAEIDGFEYKAEAAFEALRQSSASALSMRAATAELDAYEGKLEALRAKGRHDIDLAAAEAKLPTKIAPTGQAPVFATPTAMPAGAPLSSAGAKLDVFANDSAAQLRLAAQAYQDALTPQDKYRVGQAELQLLVAKGLIDQNAYTAAMAQLDEQMVKAASNAHKLQEEMQKLLEKSNDASAGLKAYAIQLQLNAEENGKFVFDVLTEATKAGEADASKTLMAILEERRGGHRALIHELEKMWSDYFKNLATMGMKHSMDQLLAPLGKAVSGAGGNPSAAGAAGPEGAAKTGLLSWLLPKAAGAPGAGGTASLSAAGTMLTHAGTELLSAAMALRASAGVGGASAGGGGGSPFGDITELAGAIPFFASGGDATPGSSFVSGEAGAERVDLDRSGGAHITPLGAGAPSGDTNHFYDMRNSVVTEDLMRRAEAASAIRASESRMMSAMPAMQREINLRKRS